VDGTPTEFDCQVNINMTLIVRPSTNRTSQSLTFSQGKEEEANGEEEEEAKAE
jgi:hypothetical protein